MADLTPQIEQAAAEPQSAASDGQQATSHSLPDLIAADKYLRQLDAVADPNAAGGPKSAWRGVRMARAIPPGTT